MTFYNAGKQNSNKISLRHTHNSEIGVWQCLLHQTGFCPKYPRNKRKQNFAKKNQNQIPLH